MMDANNRNIITTIIRKSISEKLDFHTNALEYAIVRLFICYSSSWENTNLEGYLVLVNDAYNSCLKLQIFDFINFNKEFEVELYSNIEEGYEIISDVFHSLEYMNFFIGLNFSEKSQAEKMRNKIFLFSKLKSQDLSFTSYIYDPKILTSTVSIASNNLNNTKSAIFESKVDTEYNKPNIDKSKADSIIQKINDWQIRFKKVERIFEFEIKKNSFSKKISPTFNPEMSTRVSQFLYEKYNQNKLLDFVNIKTLYKDLVDRCENYNLNNSSIESDSVIVIEDEKDFSISQSANHKNENEEYIPYDVTKRQTISIRSNSYFKKLEEIQLQNNSNNNSTGENNINHSLSVNNNANSNITNNNSNGKAINISNEKKSVYNNLLTDNRNTYNENDKLNKPEPPTVFSANFPDRESKSKPIELNNKNISANIIVSSNHIKDIEAVKNNNNINYNNKTEQKNIDDKKNNNDNSALASNILNNKPNNSTLNNKLKNVKEIPISHFSNNSMLTYAINQKRAAYLAATQDQENSSEHSRLSSDF